MERPRCLTLAAGGGRLKEASAAFVEGPMPQAGEGGNGGRNLNVVAIVAIVLLVVIAVIALASRKPSDQVRETTTTSESSTNPPGAPPAGDADVDIKVDIPDSVTIRAD